MTSSGSPVSITKYWIKTPDDAAKEKSAIDMAKKINQETFALPNVYGFAKAICRVVKVKGKSVAQWQVCVLTTNFQGNKAPDLVTAAHQNEPPQTVTLTPKEEFSELFSAIKEVITSIETCKHLIVKPDEIDRKLKKLILYLLRTPSWPYTNSIAEVTKVFADYKKCCELKHLLSQNQASFNRFVSQLNKPLHQRGMTLEEISLKIITKAKRLSPVGLSTFNQIRTLIKSGTERIFFDSEGKQSEERKDEGVKSFNFAFALHTYVYKPNIDTAQTLADLEQAIDRLVTLLIAYDHTHNAATLVDFTIGLMRHMERPFDSPLTWTPTNLAPLTWTFGALVRNQKFIEYMQPLRGQTEEIATLASKLLKEQTWRPIADFIVSLGNQYLFGKVLEARVGVRTMICTLDEEQLDRIFLKLNERLAEENPLFKEAYKEMYLSFLKGLAESNKLHFLKSYASHAPHRPLFIKNLKELDFSFMEEVTTPPTPPRSLPLEAFFGNATYIAVVEPSIPPNMEVKRTIVKLLAQSTTHPVNNKNELFKALVKVLADCATGFAPLCAGVLSKLGELAQPGKDSNGQLLPVETWLSSSVIPFYHSLKECVLMCLPLQWRQATFNGAENLLHRVCLHQGKLYLIDCNLNRQLILKNLFTGNLLSPRPQTVLVSELVDKITSDLKGEIQLPINHDAVSRLTVAYRSFYDHEHVKREVETLLIILFNKMRTSGEIVSFSERVSIVVEFLQALSPFLKKLEKLIEKRFFHQGRLKNKITLSLITQCRTSSPESPIGETLHNLTDASDLTMSPQLVQDLAQLVSRLCIKDIEEILQRNPLNLLAQIAPQFESVICRKLDELSYTKTDFIDAFCAHAANRNQTLPANATLQQVVEALAIKETIMANYGDFLKKRPIPVHFILPNQALAIQLCLSPHFEAHDQLPDRHLLIKLGTGQGKSLVIALSALHEAEKVRNKVNGRVFVFTSYDHLAKRDHEFGEYFFKKERLKSICISTLNDVANLTDETKIIYADIETIDGIVQEIMLKLLQNHASMREKEFIRMIYGTSNEELRIILDEYDLLLYDLEVKSPYVTDIPHEFLTPAFVRQSNHRNVWSALADAVDATPHVGANRQAADPHTGREFTTVNWYQDGTFHLPASVMRLSNLLKRAKRVIGLSGTAAQGESHSLNDPLFFEIPSSQDPQVFGTKIQESPTDPFHVESGISCRQKIKFDIPEEEVSTIPQSTIDSYCNAIVSDIRTVREPIQSDEGTYQRPGLIFADPHFKYKTPGNALVKSLWTTLSTALDNSGIPLTRLTANVLDADLQRIADSGATTLSTIKYGRGADIRVSLDIEEGLHVTIARPVVHKRLFLQLVGRTGRMGRKGSYSVITLGDPIMPATTQQRQQSEFCGALHELTKYFVNKLTGTAPYNATECKKWLMFLGRSFSTRRFDRKINRNLATQICGNDVTQNTIIQPFFE